MPYTPSSHANPDPIGPIIDTIELALASLVACRVSRVAAQSINNATWTAISFDTEAFDSAGMHSLVANQTRITVPATAVYRVSGHGSMVGLSGAAVIAARVLKNGGATPAIDQVAVPGIGTAGNGPPFSDLVSLAAGDYLELQIFHTHGSAQNTYLPTFSVERILA